MFWKAQRLVFVPSSGLQENKIKCTFYPGVPLSLSYLNNNNNNNNNNMFH